jgi:hypothetical protein
MGAYILLVAMSDEKWAMIISITVVRAYIK